MTTATLPRVSTILVIGSDGSQLGRMSFRDARKLADEQGLDLVSVGDPDSQTPVFKIMDEGKWQYESKKKAKRQHSKKHMTKTMRFSLRIDEHDLATKLKRVSAFLLKSQDVRLEIIMKGRREREKHEAAVAQIMSIVGRLGCEITPKDLQKSDRCVAVVVRPDMVKTV